MSDMYCDRCGAQAQSRFILPTGDLLFCGHHSREYGPGLEDIAEEDITFLTDNDLIGV